MKDQNGIRWLYDELPELIAAGILGPETAAALRAHYGEVEPAKGRLNLAFLLFGVLGAGLIGLGIIMLFAYNWDTFSRQGKTIIGFLPLLCGQILVGWTLLSNRDSTAWRESSATFLLLGVGASLAIISQIYHIESNLKNFMLAWSLLSLPLAYLLNAGLVTILYLAGVTWWALEYPAMTGEPVVYWLLVALTGPVFWQSYRRDPVSPRSLFLSWLGAIVLAVGVGVSLTDVVGHLWVLIYTAFFAMLYVGGGLLVEPDTSFKQRPWHALGAGVLAVLALWFTFEEVWRYFVRDDYWRFDELNARLSYGIVLLLIAGTLTLLVQTYRRNRLHLLGFGIMPVLVGLGYVDAYGSDQPVIGMIIFNLYVFVISIYTISRGIRLNRLGIVNGGMIMLSFLILFRFLDSDLSFMLKGIAFIIVGAAFLLTNYVLMRRNVANPPDKV